MKGVYFLLKGDDVIYIGQSSDMQRRICDHKEKDYDSFVFVPCKNRKALERRMIRLIKPTRNIKLYQPLDVTDFLLRLKMGAFERLKKAAEVNNRSVNGEIAFTIEEKYL